MKLAPWIWVIGCMCPPFCSAQTLEVPSNLKLAYNGSVLYPGVRLGVEYPLAQLDVTRHRRRKSDRHVQKKRYLSAELGYYHHTDFHDNIYLLLGWQSRKQRPRGFFTEFSPAVGYSRTFLGGETYRVDEVGQVHRVHLAGYHYAMVAIGGGVGYSFSPRWSGYFRPSLLTMFPSVNLVYIRPTVEIGLIWQPKQFLSRSIQVKSKIKGKKPKTT